MKLLAYIDVFGWALESMVRGWRKHSAHKIDYKLAQEARKEDAKGYDGWVVMSTRNWEFLPWKPPKDRTVSGIHSEHPRARQNLDGFAGVIAVSQPIMQMAREHKPKTHLRYVQNAVDGDVFRPSGKTVSTPVEVKQEQCCRLSPTFTSDPGPTADTPLIGWTGDANRKLKRFDLFDQMPSNGFIKSVRSDWGDRWFKRGRNQDVQVQFLHSLRCLVQCSETEGMSLATLEAAACGIPVIATNVGDTAQVVPKGWLLDVDAKACAEQMADKVGMLVRNEGMAYAYGMSLRLRLENEGWLWSSRAREYDKMVEDCIK